MHCLLPYQPIIAKLPNSYTRQLLNKMQEPFSSTHFFACGVEGEMPVHGKDAWEHYFWMGAVEAFQAVDVTVVEFINIGDIYLHPAVIVP